MTAPAPTRACVGLRSERGPVLGAIMLSTALIALDSTIIATAVPSIVDDLGGFGQFPWLFSVFLLTQAVTLPVYGKLADVYGRKPLLLFGIGVSVAASVVCGLAWSMPALIVGRALQGIGAGAIQPIGITVIGDLYSVAERATVQGTSRRCGPRPRCWDRRSAACSATTCPGAGSSGSTCRWARSRRGRCTGASTRRSSGRAHSLDLAGAALLTVGCSLLIVGLLEGGSAWAWTSPTSGAVHGMALLALGVFVLVERRAVEPVLPLWVFRRRVRVGGNLAAFGVGALLIGLSTYLPTWAQGVLGTGALEAGLALGALTLGWPLAASQAGRLYLRIGFRDTALIGVTFAVSGSVLTALLPATATLWQVAGTMFLTGVGLGLSTSPLMVAAQSVVGWDRRGVVTATNMFGRSIGSAIGAALFGAIANTTLTREFASAPDSLRGLLPDDVDGTAAALATPGPVADYAREALHAASHSVFVAVALTVVGVALAVALVPRRMTPLVFDDADERGPAAKAAAGG